MDEGPLAYHGSADFTAGPTAVGRPWTYSLVILKSPTRHSFVLDRVRLVARTPGLHVLRIQAGGPQRGPSKYGLLPGFPRMSDLHPIGGAVVPARGSPGWGQGTAILVTIAATRSGALGFRAIQVDYHDGSNHYRTAFEDGAGLCVRMRADACMEEFVRAGVKFAS